MEDPLGLAGMTYEIDEVPLHLHPLEKRSVAHPIQSAEELMEKIAAAAQ